MKWVFLIFVGVMCWGGFVQHTHNEEGVKEGVEELFKENGYSNIIVEGVNLPISYTFLSEKVVSEVFTKRDGRSQKIDVTITPIEGFPIVSIFFPPSFYMETQNLENLGLEFLKWLFEK